MQNEIIKPSFAHKVKDEKKSGWIRIHDLSIYTHFLYRPGDVPSLITWTVHMYTYNKMRLTTD